MALQRWLLQDFWRFERAVYRQIAAAIQGVQKRHVKQFHHLTPPPAAPLRLFRLLERLHHVLDVDPSCPPSLLEIPEVRGGCLQDIMHLREGELRLER